MTTMTNSESILEDLLPYPVRRSLVERKCEKHGIGANDAVSDEKTVTRIVIEILVQMLSLNNVAEGGVSISFDRAAVENYIRSLCREAGIDVSEFIKLNTVTFIDDW